MVKYGSSTAKKVATNLDLARQDIYKVLAELQQLGLVERQIKIPAEFSAIPIQNACSSLLGHRAKKTSQLHKKAKKLVMDLKGNNYPKAIQDEEQEIFLIPKGDVFILRIQKAIEKAQKSIDIFSVNMNFPQGLFFLSEALEKAANRGVKIRCITDQLPKVKKGFPLLENPVFEIRIISNHSKKRFCIYDKKELSVVLSSAKSFGKSALLWSNCSSIVDTYRDYYEIMWQNAVSCKQQPSTTTVL